MSTWRRRATLLGVVAALGVSGASLSAPALARPTGAAAPTERRAAAGSVAEWSTAPGTDGRTWFVDAQGRSLGFRGFGNKTDAPAALFTDELLAAGADRGFNLLRLSFFWDELEPTQGAWNEGYLDEIETVLDRAEAHGYVVIVAMHQDVYGPAFGSRGMPEWATRTDGAPFVPQESWLLNYTQPAVQNAFEHLYEDADLRQAQIDAWLKVVDRVAGHPALFGYDLMNEPFGKIREGENLLEAAARVEAEQLTPMYQRLTDAISAVDPDRWTFIEPPNLNSLGVATSLGEVTGPKVAYYPHMYSQEVEAATYDPDGGDFTYDPRFFERWQTAAQPYALRHGLPMLVGEWGVAEPGIAGMDRFVRESLATLEAATSQGWTMWAACLGGGYCPFDAEGRDRAGIDQVIAPYVRAVAGSVTSATWDPDARVLQVRYRDSAATGPTELYVPEAKRYPEGFEVHVSGIDGPVDAPFDVDRGIVAVEVADTGRDHAICVVPAGWSGACLAADPVPTTTTVAPAPPSDPPPATPIAGSPGYTG